MFILGMMVGGFFGVLIMALLTASKRGEEYWLRKKKSVDQYIEFV